MPVTGAEVSTEAPPHSGSSTPATCMPNQNAGASRINAIAGEDEFTLRLEPSLT